MFGCCIEEGEKFPYCPSSWSPPNPKNTRTKRNRYAWDLGGIAKQQRLSSRSQFPSQPVLYNRLRKNWSWHDEDGPCRHNQQ
ncbi:hypothetical protein FA13DRAFT_1737855 [Coprinellus micaceus]|uniref:Uncharacterized protein n=1 Tax=Coprinellus micaceus TaxID=71717 RepID=A0A4Y7SVP9_COPMI|nr:hypothetical protein FA13DRAFT_1737855 [Coprinellus micaceus]